MDLDGQDGKKLLDYANEVPPTDDGQGVQNNEEIEEDSDRLRIPSKTKMMETTSPSR